MVIAYETYDMVVSYRSYDIAYETVPLAAQVGMNSNHFVQVVQIGLG